ncbi:tyrosine-type recombinase/integrase [Pseudoalteromonas phenolica]|uniref:tyrosine-type recombinase/integrase n=1 Tax=Pseudoalteromonas phenolica TaxID=161398 RepID=UPI00384BE2B1
MKIIHTDNNFTVSNLEYLDVPILLNNQMEIVKPVFRFIIYLVIQDGRIQSKKTIKSYALALYDYFSFLEANELNWDEPYLNDSQHFSISAVALYRNWSRSLLKNNGQRAVSDSTINLRLSGLKRFYEYCYSVGLISFEPWETLFKVQTEIVPSFLSHTRGQKIVKSNDLVLKTFKVPPKMISLEQCKQLICSINNKTLKLMTKLILATGLRKDELISFERRYLFEPNMRRFDMRIPIDLVPSKTGQRTKGSKPRRIFVSAPLMRELWDHIHFGEGVSRANKFKSRYGYDSPFVFLNRFGEPYSEAGLNNAYRKLYTGAKKKIDFKVSPHMLRHTYATIELYSESQRTNIAAALTWIKERLGHSSIVTTSVYLHCIESLQEHELSTYQNELDAME